MNPSDSDPRYTPPYEGGVSRAGRWILTNWRLHRVIGLAVPVFSLGVGLYFNQADFFARSGSIICLMGGLLTVRPYLRGTGNTFFRDTGYADQPPHGKQKPQHEARKEAGDADKSAMRWGVYYVPIGTVVWGYGDLILKALWVCTN